MRSANLAPSSTRAPRTTPTLLAGVDTSWVERSTKAAVGTEDRHESGAGARTRRCSPSSLPDQRGLLPLACDALLQWASLLLY